MSTGAISKLMVQIEESLAIGKSTPAPLVTCVLRLHSNPVAWSENTNIVAITECTFDGYAPQTLISAFSGPFQNLEGDIVVSPTVAPFSCTGTVTSNTVYGVYITGPGEGDTSWLVGTTVASFQPTNGMEFSITPQIALSGAVDACLC
jgi:hypothetical protein